MDQLSWRLLGLWSTALREGCGRRTPHAHTHTHRATPTNASTTYIRAHLGYIPPHQLRLEFCVRSVHLINPIGQGCHDTQHGGEECQAGDDDLVTQGKHDT